jgi:hypothetical protein
LITLLLAENSSPLPTAKRGSTTFKCNGFIGSLSETA